MNIFAQTINNTTIKQNNGEVIIQYDLYGKPDLAFTVHVLYSTDQINWEEIEKVHGEVGDSIFPGRTKQIVLWIDHLANANTKLFFKISAVYPTIDLTKKGTLNDAVGNTYTWIRYDNTKWMTQNLKSIKEPSECGTLYNYTAAINACPENWKLPTDDEWIELEKHFGMNAAKSSEFGLREIKNLKIFSDSGFVLNECKYLKTLYPNQVAVAFWTNTVNKLLYLGYSDKYIARIVRLNENKISRELREKTDELSVRCIKSAIYFETIESVIEANLTLKNKTGAFKDVYTGEKFEYISVGNTTWLKKDIIGTFIYTDINDKCPVGWKLPEEQEWKDLFSYYKPSIELENESTVISERISTSGLWSFNMSTNDYWMESKYYIYNTYWINKDNKEDSKKLIAYPSNKSNSTGWVNKQTNEKAKLRCVLDNKDYAAYSNSIETGKFADSRDNKEYTWVNIDNKTWMSENLSFNMGENSTCRDNIKMNCEAFGYLYNISVAETACPAGWQIPSSDDWQKVLAKTANNMPSLCPFGKSGFNLLLGGEILIDDSGKKPTNIFTAKLAFIEAGNIGYYYFDSNGKIEKADRAKKKDLLYIRCVKK
ncbi:MAG: hypothetical protein A2041_14140 [Bacteroidetes bacterium GWA2_31_9b]|nr:MAG: hypothetical protein A2041_14140 [Bacteroidetes bacterium GWA2_31_9b]